MKKGSYIQVKWDTISQLDVAVPITDGRILESPNFQYRTVTYGTTPVIQVCAIRKEKALGGLGEYRICMMLRGVPPTQRSWSCSTTPACNSFLPE